MPAFPPGDQSLSTLAGALVVAETSIALPTLNTAFIDSAAVPVTGTKKTLYLVVTTALTWVTSGQPTWQPFAARGGFLAAGGAATQLTASQVLLGAAQNLGPAAATSLAVGSYRMSSGAVAELQWPDPFIGVQLVFPSALTAGAASLFVEVSS